MVELWDAKARGWLIELIRRDALRFGDFTLAGGAKSGFYVDCRQVTLSAQGAALVGELTLRVARSFNADAVGGLTMGADPIVGATLAAAGHGERHATAALRGFLVRKEAKGHGLARLVEGPLKAGDRVLVVEDVATSGASALKAADAAEAAGAKVVAVACVLDRDAGARAACQTRGYGFVALAGLADLGLA